MNSTASVDTERKRLLARAARCYRRAGQENDACRCLERAGDFAAAAHIHEHAGRWMQAGQCFEYARLWPLAARCFLNAELPLDAARCQQEADNFLEAAWILAHHARRYSRSRAVLKDFKPEGAGQELAFLLVRARCATARKNGGAGAVVRRVLPRLSELVPGPDRDRVMNWSFILTHAVLDRPDLTNELFAAAWHAGIDVRKRWEGWAEQRLGSSECLAFLEEDAEV